MQKAEFPCLWPAVPTCTKMHWARATGTKPKHSVAELLLKGGFAVPSSMDQDNTLLLYTFMHSYAQTLGVVGGDNIQQKQPSLNSLQQNYSISFGIGLKGITSVTLHSAAKLLEAPIADAASASARCSNGYGWISVECVCVCDIYQLSYISKVQAMVRVVHECIKVQVICFYLEWWVKVHSSL